MGGEKSPPLTFLQSGVYLSHDMKLKTQIELLRMIRKRATPAERIIRPKKGGGYIRSKRIENYE